MARTTSSKQREAGSLKPRQRVLLDRVIVELESQPTNPMPPVIIARNLGVPVQAVEGVLKFGLKSGEVVNLAGAYFVALKCLKEMEEKLVAYAAESDNLAVSELRKLLDTPREMIGPLLEYFDKVGVTVSEDGFRRINR